MKMYSQIDKIGDVIGAIIILLGMFLVIGFIFYFVTSLL